MSHTTSVKSIKIMSMAAVELAVQNLQKAGIKITLIPNQTPRAYFPNQQGLGRADFVLHLSDAKFDVGLYKQEDGSFEPRTDFWAKSVENVLGVKASSPDKTDQAKLGKFFQEYALSAATLEARKKGYMVTRVPQSNGTVQLRMAVPN